MIFHKPVHPYQATMMLDLLEEAPQKMDPPEEALQVMNPQTGSQMDLQGIVEEHQVVDIQVQVVMEMMAAEEEECTEIRSLGKQRMYS